MKRALLISLVVIGLTLAFVRLCFSQYYITQITNNSCDDLEPMINNNGYMVWRGWTGSDWEIFLFDGTTIANISNNPYNDYVPQINDHGQAVWLGWGGSGWKVYLYDGTNTIELADSCIDGDPQTSNSGHVVWVGNDGEGYEIFLYDGTNIIQLTDDSYLKRGPQVNDQGQAVWVRWDGDYDVFFYDGTKTIQLTDNNYEESFWGLRINNSGHVVWDGSDGSDHEIFLYDGTKTTQLTDNSYEEWEPRINDRGQVVWTGWYGQDTEILFYNGDRIIQITDDGYDDYAPEINNKGQVIWKQWDGQFYNLMLYDGKKTIPIASNLLEVGVYPHINDRGDVAWEAKDGADWEVFLAARVTLLSPDVGETIPSGAIHTIRWSAPAQAVNFRLSYSMDNGATWIPITKDYVPGTSYDWTVPTPPGNKGKCFVKVVGYDNSDMKVGSDKSDGPFTIEVIKLTYPTLQEDFTSDSTVTITWTTNSTKKPVAKTILYYTKDAGVTWNLIKSLKGDPNPRSFEWVIPTVKKAKTNCRVKVVLKDAKYGIIGSDVSDSYFTIQPARTP